MKIGIDNYSYHRYFGEIYPGQPVPNEKWNLAEFVDHILSMEHDELVECVSVETCFLTEPKKSIIRELDRLALPIFFAWGHPNGFMDIGLEQAKDQFEFYLDLSQKFGANAMRIAGSSIHYYPEPHQPQLERIKSYLENLLPLAESYQIKLAIENHGDFYLRELNDIIQFFSTPYLGLTLDTGNFLRFDEDPLDALNLIGDKVYIVHAKDLALKEGFRKNDPRRFGCVPPGSGILDFPSLMQGFYSTGFEGPILIEISGMHPDYEEMGEHKMIGKGLLFLNQIRNELENENE